MEKGRSGRPRRTHIDLDDEAQVRCTRKYHACRARYMNVAKAKSVWKNRSKRRFVISFYHQGKKA